MIRLRRNQIPIKTLFLSLSLSHTFMCPRTYLLPRVSTSFVLQTRRVQFLVNSQTNSIPIWSPRVTEAQVLDVVNGDRIRWSTTGEVTSATTSYLFFYLIWQHHILIDISNQNVSCVSVFLLYFFFFLPYCTSISALLMKNYRFHFQYFKGRVGLVKRGGIRVLSKLLWGGTERAHVGST